MQSKENIFDQIRNSVKTTAPGARLILFGSYARGEQTEESDIDLLILVDKEQLSYSEQSKITYSLFLVELQYGISISPLIYTKDSWENKHMVTPFYENVNNEGVLL